MKALVQEGYGATDVLALREIDTPQIDENGVLVEVHAAAVNALIGSPLSRDELLEAALFSETQVAGRHLDNIAPSYMGGIVLIRSLDPIDVMAVPVPAALHVVLASPEQSLRTAEARASYKRALDLTHQEPERRFLEGRLRELPG